MRKHKFILLFTQGIFKSQHLGYAECCKITSLRDMNKESVQDAFEMNKKRKKGENYVYKVVLWQPDGLNEGMEGTFIHIFAMGSQVSKLLQVFVATQQDGRRRRGEEEEGERCGLCCWQVNHEV